MMFSWKSQGPQVESAADTPEGRYAAIMERLDAIDDSLRALRRSVDGEADGEGDRSEGDGDHGDGDGDCDHSEGDGDRCGGDGSCGNGERSSFRSTRSA